MRVLFVGRFGEAEALMERNRELGHRAQTADITYTGARIPQLFVLRREAEVGATAAATELDVPGPPSRPR